MNSPSEGVKKMLKTVAGSLAAVGTMVALSVPAHASCVAASPLPVRLDAARVAFVGTVVATWDNDRRATVRVEAVWKGQRLPSEVQVSGSPVSGLGTFTSIDRRFQVGQRYLFLPTNDEPPFDDNICSGTQPYTQEVAALAPTGAVPPEQGPAPWMSRMLWLLIGAGVPALALAVFAARAVWRTR